MIRNTFRQRLLCSTGFVSARGAENAVEKLLHELCASACNFCPADLPNLEECDATKAS